MFGPIPISELDRWRINYSEHPALPVITESAGISLELVKNYIAQIEKDCPGVTGLRVYFIRYPLDKDLDYIVRAGHSKLSQVSMAFVPVKGDGTGSFGGNDYPLPSDPTKILTLPVCEPTGEVWEESTGLCPPKCIW